jgi:hypothetical protein
MSNANSYKVVDGTAYLPGTPDEVVRVLEAARASRTRLAFVHSWSDGAAVRGYVGRSTGFFKVPLVVHNARSLGGDCLSEDTIVEIRESAGGRVLYKAP